MLVVLAVFGVALHVKWVAEKGDEAMTWRCDPASGADDPPWTRQARPDRLRR
jgi:hypothetical protein